MEFNFSVTNARHLGLQRRVGLHGVISIYVQKLEAPNFFAMPSSIYLDDWNLDENSLGK